MTCLARDNPPRSITFPKVVRLLSGRYGVAMSRLRQRSWIEPGWRKERRKCLELMRVSARLRRQYPDQASGYEV